jgi:hypothetical protein
VVGCIIGLSLVFGLLTIVVLLGYGLVRIPLSSLRFASNKRALRHCQLRAAEFSHKQTTKETKVQTLLNIAFMIKVTQELEKYRKIIIEDVGSKAV